LLQQSDMCRDRDFGKKPATMKQKTTVNTENKHAIKKYSSAHILAQSSSII